MSLVVDAHREMLADEARIGAFRQAIQEVVQPEDIVLDLGSGTGILGLLACRAGARRVYSIEQGGMIEVARAIARANGFEDRMVFLKDLSTRVTLPEKVDVVVADQIGRFGFEAGLLEYFSDARERFLKPEGTTIPSRVDLFVAAVEHPEGRNWVDFWDRCVAGLDLRPAYSQAANTGYPVKFVPEHLLGDPALLTSLDLSVADTAAFKGEATAVAKRAGSLHGIGGWFSAQLSPHVQMSNSPLAKHPINRRNVFFPIDQPVALEEGDCVRVQMHIVPSQLHVTWKVDVLGNGNFRHGQKESVAKGSFTQSTFRGMLLAREDLQRTQPHFVPQLTPWGEARLAVLRLCDGKRTLSQIEQELFRRYPDLFPSLGKAAEFVAEVVTRYCQ